MVQSAVVQSADQVALEAGNSLSIIFKHYRELTTPEQAAKWLVILPLRDIVATLKPKLQGYWNYYCVIGNSERTSAYSYVVVQLVCKWLNRRSQRKSFTAESFKAAWERWHMPQPRVNEEPQPKSARQIQPCPA